MSLHAIYREARPEMPGEAVTEEALASAVARARQAWPAIAHDEEALVRALAGLPASVTALEDRAIVEVALCVACGRGDAAALARLEAEYLDGARAALAAMKLDDALRDEALQETRRKLLVGDPPKLVGYAGRGSLRGLLKVTATRTAISMLRKAGREAPGDDAVVDVDGERDPELAYLKARYRAVFRDAFADAVAGLEPRERNLMRLHFLRRVTLERLATMYGVHRATIVRHLAAIRESIERATKAGLRERLGADRAEVDEVLDLIRSRYDASVERLLRTEG